MCGRKAILPGLLALLVSCTSNDNSDKRVLRSDTGIMTFDDFTQEDFKDEWTFDLFQEAMEESKDLDFESARTLLERVRKSNPKNTIIYNALGLTELELGNYDKGIRYLKKAYELDSTYLEAYVNMAIGYNALKEYEKAIDVCELAIKKGTRRIVLCAANCNKSIAEYEQEDLDEAINSVSKAIEFSDSKDLTIMLEQMKSEWVAKKDLLKVLNNEN